MKKRVLLYFLLSILFSVLIWNFFIGNFIYNWPNVDQVSDIGKRYAPNSKIVYSTEGFSSIITDKYGFNNDNTNLENEPVVLVLGDSHTEAFQVARNRNFVSLTQNKIKDAIIYNAGISGNSISEYINYGKGYLRYFHPQIVVIQVTYDDFTSDALNKTKNTFIIPDGHSYKISAPKPMGPQNSVALKEPTNSVVAFPSFKEIKDTFNPFTNYFKIKKTLALNNFNHPSKRPFLPNNISNNDKVVENNQDYDRLINWELSQIKNIYGNNVVLLYLPVAPRLNIDKNIALMKDPIESKVKSIVVKNCIEKNIDFIDLEDSFNNLFENDHIFPRGFSNSKIGSGHMNESGHLATSEKLIQYLQQKGY